MRVLFFTGKGGVGKTSVASATGLKAAQQGYRTVVMSLDLAHSLSDAFDVDKGRLEEGEDRICEVRPNLFIQEMDVQQEIRTHWGNIYEYIADLLSTAGLDDVVAEEIALLPGMAEVVGLFYINRYYRRESYDLVILDCAPTGESLRFLSMPTALEWYMNKIFRAERSVMKVARPLANMLYDVPMPEEDYFEAVEKIYERLKGVQDLLGDPSATSARLVTNPEKMVVKESQRAFMYMSLYGVNVDMVVANRVYSDEIRDTYLKNWKKTQEEYLRRIKQSFQPVPVRTVELFDDQIVGTDAIQKLGDTIYGDEDPTDLFHQGAPLRFTSEGDVTKALLKLPFAEKEEIDLSRNEDQLIVTIGNFKRYVTLPRSMAHLEPLGAEMQGDTLCVKFGGADDVQE